MGKKLNNNRWYSCNVLQTGTEARHLWTFGAGKNGFSLDHEEALPLDAPLPARTVARDWRTLLQPKLNLALLPLDKVFLRVTQLPVSEFGETVSMVELQLEKLSPLPVTQIVWSVQVLPHTVDNLQTVIVIIVARDIVEQMLGELEGKGYLADRLELPILDQLLATPITGDGAWVYPGENTGAFTGLAAWWYGGVLRNLGLLHVPATGNPAETLKEQLTQMAWAGELEGWLTSPPQWRLVATEAVAANWQPLFRAWLGQPVEVIAPLSEPELVALTANRAGRADPRANILPAEYTTRYHQQFVDRLWMRSLGTLLAVYVGAVMIYFAALSVQNLKANNLEEDTANTYRTYTNVVREKAQLTILQDRQALKYASLDCWRVIADLLPEGFMVLRMQFEDRTKTFYVTGTAPVDDARQVVAFGSALRKATVRGELLFSNVEQEASSANRDGLPWTFKCTLARSEEAVR